MIEQARHQHRCQSCEHEWPCQRTDCDQHADCESCEHDHFETWAESRGLTTFQPELAPVSAWLAEKE